MSAETVKEAASACVQMVAGMRTDEALAALALASAGIIYSAGKGESSARRRTLWQGHVEQIQVSIGVLIKQDQAP